MKIEIKANQKFGKISLFGSIEFRNKEIKELTCLYGASENSRKNYDT